MIDASLAFFWPDGMMAQTLIGEGEVAMPGPTLYELYQLTQTADGHLIYFAASDVEFFGLFRALGLAPCLFEGHRIFVRFQLPLLRLGWDIFAFIASLNVRVLINAEIRDR